MDADQDEPVESEDQFWEELDDIVSTPCRTHDRIDDTLRTWLSFIATNKGTGPPSAITLQRLNYLESYVQTENALLRASFALSVSSLFTRNDAYVRQQITHSLLQEDDPLSIHLAAGLLLLDGRRHEETFELLNSEGVFPRLVLLVKDGTDDELGCHRRLLELLYEMSRIQQITWSHLTTVDDEFVLYLFKIIESISGDASDPYYYPVIRTLLVLNEQYMVSTHDPNTPSTGGAMTNRVIKFLSTHGRAYKAFGESIIFLLNRESETSLQLLILKILYLLFTTPPTYEYFYTNDLYVLTDILLRNLLDLPASTTLSPNTQTLSLRHTYLRVLHPMLAHTQLSQPPHYKRSEICRTLSVLTEAGPHFDKPDDTTIRLAGRCLDVPWLTSQPAVEQDVPMPVFSLSIEEEDPESDNEGADSAKPDDPGGGGEGGPGRNSQSSTENPDGGKKAVAQRALLGLQPRSAQASSLSVREVASQKEKPGVLTPSKAREIGADRESRAAKKERSPFEDG